jgi:chemotaxis protein methyltransferase CheR
MNRANNEDIEIGISGIRKLTDVVKQQYGFDLGVYAGTSLKRRISRIIQINDMNNLEDLIRMLETKPAFFAKFQTQMVVDGTEFFRDPAFWRCFRDEICKTLKNNQLKIKIWLPGCASGEEVISTAITLKEAGIYDKTILYATDLNNDIIELSKNKIYSNHILEISENNFKRFREDEAADFSVYSIKQAAGFTFRSELYENITYDVFNETDTKSIKSVNVILYRNKFIYYNAIHQERLLELFTERLGINGYFAIGNKENISFCKDAKKYTAINEIEKIYRKIIN